jgi:molybdopterin-binding protein
VNSNSVVRVDSVQVIRNKRLALKDISVELFQGEVLTLLGPNGSGKSTLLHVLGLLRRPEQGNVYFHNQLVSWGQGLLPLRRKMATVFQQPLLLDTSVRENVALGLKLRSVASKEISQRVNHWLERMGIGDLAERSARQLSGGEAQRVSMARALALEPEVLLLDEPMKELDTPTREALMEELKAILAQTHTTTVFVTHDRSEAVTLSDRVAILMDGALVQVGATEEVFNRPVSEVVANFVGVGLVVPGRIIECEEGLALVEISPGVSVAVASDLAIGSLVFVSLRPEDVTIYGDASSIVPSSARNRFAGTITRVQQIGSLYKVVVDCGFLLPALLTKQSLVELELAPGKRVGASFKATAAHLISRVQ